MTAANALTESAELCWWRVLASLLWALMLFLFAGIALAQPSVDELVLAEALFRDARRLMGEQRWDEACTKLEDSHRLDPQPGVLLNMAVCHEKQGRTATAWSEFRQALAFAKIDRRADREQLAREHIKTLEPQLARLKIVVVDANRTLSGFVVERDGTALPNSAWGTAVPIDPGEHAVRATANGHEPFESRVIGVAGKTVAIIVPLLAKPPPPEPPSLPEPSPTPPSPQSMTPAAPVPAPAPAEEPSDPPWVVAGWALIGVGSAALIAAGGLGIHALIAEAEASKSCSDTTCPDQQSLDTSNAALASATAADPLWVLGGAAVVTGIVLLLVPTDDDSAASVALGPTGVFVQGRW